MSQVDLAFTPAIEQARLIRTRQCSPRELVELYLERIERLDPTLGSFVTVMAEQALAEAREKTESLTRVAPEDLPPLFGVPTAIKDLNPVAGVRCAYGVPALMDNIATYDDGVVTRIKQAGMIILGKTATSELGSFPYTEPIGLPPTRNPWHREYTAGGSSGGAAAALAAGLCAVTQGSDGAGSIRGPAFCCGVVGIKPARGRVSHAPLGDVLGGIGTNGSLGRSVADAAALLDVMAGYITGDPYWLPDPEPAFLQTALRSECPPLRIGFSTRVLPVGTAHPLCEQAVLDTVQHLEALGHAVQEGCPDFTDLPEPFITVWCSAVALTRLPDEALEPTNRWLRARAGSCGDYLRALGQIQTIARQIVAFFDTVDVLVLPTYMHPPIPVGAWAELEPEAAFERMIHWVAPCPPFNASGQPAIAIPTGFTPEGVPLGVQLVGRPAAEATLIALAAQLEAAHPWPHRPAWAAQ